MRSTKLTVCIAVFLGCTALPGCGGEAIKFNNKMAQTTKDLQAMGAEFGTALKGKNPVEMKAAHERLVGKFQKLKAETDAIKPPSSAEAQEFHQAFQTLMKNQEKTIEMDYKEIVTILGSPVPDIGRIQSLLRTVESREEIDLNALKAAQGKFAKANGITIK